MDNRGFVIATVVATLAGAPFASPPAIAADLARGKAQYEARCGGCHADSVHGRITRKALDFDAVRGWVVRWNASLVLGWDREEVDDVAAYLNFTYYKYACPPSVCKVVSSYPASRRDATRIAAR